MAKTNKKNPKEAAIIFDKLIKKSLSNPLEEVRKKRREISHKIDRLNKKIELLQIQDEPLAAEEKRLFNESVKGKPPVPKYIVNKTK